MLCHSYGHPGQYVAESTQHEFSPASYAQYHPSLPVHSWVLNDLRAVVNIYNFIARDTLWRFRVILILLLLMVKYLRIQPQVASCRMIRRNSISGSRSRATSGMQKQMGYLRVKVLGMESHAQRDLQNSRLETLIWKITPIKRSKWHRRKTRQALIRETARGSVAYLVAISLFRNDQICEDIMRKFSIKTRYCLSIFPIIFKFYIRLT